MANIPLKTVKFPGLNDTYTVPQVDSTLAVTGAAADAKAVGDALTELNERIGNMDTATSTDVGKALKVKTVAGGKVTQWEFGDAGGADPSVIEQAVMDWLDEHPEATTTVEDGSITKSKLHSSLTIAKIDSYASPLEYGAVGDGVTDDTAAFVAAENSDKPAIYVPKGIYNITGFSTSKSMIMDAEAWLTTNTLKGDVITIAGNSNTYSLNLRLGGFDAHYGVKVNGNYNHFEKILIDGLQHDGSIWEGRVNSGIAVFGSYNTFDFVGTRNFVQINASATSNRSAPQGISLSQNATMNFFADVNMDNGRAGIVNAALVNTLNRFGVLSVTNCIDNAAYIVGGGRTEIGTLIHHCPGSEDGEGLCVITDGADANTPVSEMSRVSVGTFISTGDYYYSIRIHNTGEIKIGNMFVKANIKHLMWVENGNYHSGTVDIDNLVFDGSLYTPFALNGARGTLQSLRLGRVDIKDNHKESDFSIKTSGNKYAILSMVERFKIDKLNIEFLDAESEYVSYDFELQIELRTNLVDSYIGKVQFKKPDSSGEAYITFRDAKQPGLIVTHGYYEYASAANVLKIPADNRYADRVYSIAPPRYGTWNTGDVLMTSRQQSMKNSELGFICIEGGTPGTWASIRCFPSEGAVRYSDGKLQYFHGQIHNGSWNDIPTT